MKFLRIRKFSELSEDTYNFFKKVAGYDTLRMILCKKAILCEGDSDELVIQKAYMQWPVKGPSCFSKDIFATSYVWGVLNDSRIIKE